MRKTNYWTDIAGPTWMYKLFSANGGLLYVGVSNDPAARLANHRRKKEWWRDVHSVRFAWLASRADAFRAERAVIAAEAPRYNVARPKAVA